jgi:hemin uptake protein HemP
MITIIIYYMNQYTPNSFEPLNTELPIMQHLASVLCPRLYSKDLFVSSEVIIKHSGEEYRLRLTRQGKLILTK